MRESSSKGLKCVGTFDGDLRSCSDGSAADMEEDEGGDDEGVDRNLGVEDVGMQECTWIEAEVSAARESEAADDERDDAEKDKEAEYVGEEVVGGADGVGRGDGDWEETFDCVDEIDEAVEDETVKDEGVEETNRGALLEGAALGERGGESVDEAAGEIIKAGFGVRRTAANAEIEAIEALCAQRDRDQREDKESDFLRKWEHGFNEENKPQGLKPPFVMRVLETQG